MKGAIVSWLLSPGMQTSFMAPALRKMVSALGGLYDFSPFFLNDFQATERPHYAHCLLNAAILARALGLNRISAIEFGVAGGNGLVFMSEFAEKVKRGTGIEIDCYGFDTGEGMPEPEGVRDLPYWFQAKQYRMEQEALRRRLPQAKLIIGNIRDTLDRFIDSHKPAPIGAVLNDLDYWSSTAQSFTLFERAADRPESFLPRIFMYFDDIIGTPMEMYGRYNGQLCAIEDFNSKYDNIKIHLNQDLLGKFHINHRLQIYYAHLLDHPLYDQYIGQGMQEVLEHALKLRNL